MEPLPTALPSCSLGQTELEVQLGRYRAVGGASRMLARTPRRIELVIHSSVDADLVERLVAVERACCPFFAIEWEPDRGRLAVAVPDARHEPALDAIVDALTP